MTLLARVAARLFDTPLLIRPETAGVIVSSIAERLGLDRGLVDPGLSAEPSAYPFEPSAASFRGTPVRQNGDGRVMYQLDGDVAIVPCLGELINRGAWVGASSGLTSYEGLEASLRAAVADDAATAIVLDINSPGGEAAGALELGEVVRSLDASKPIYSFVNGTCASAAYAVASGARRIIASPSAVLGSIGVVVMHRDVSAALDRAGVKTTIIHAGAYKADGSPFKALAPDARARIQGHVDALFDLFVGLIAGQRGLDLQAVRDMEAGIYLGAAAVAAGLADEVGGLDDVLALIARSKDAPGLVSPPSYSLKTGKTGAAMTTPAPKTEPTPAAAFTQAQLDAALASAAPAASAAGASAERLRVSAILGHAEAVDRPALASHLAFNTDMSPEACAPILAAAPKTAAAAATPLNRLAGNVPMPKVDAVETLAADPAKAAATSWDDIVGDLNAKAGFKR
jgi:signal peptide peptidase SppA